MKSIGERSTGGVSGGEFHASKSVASRILFLPLAPRLLLFVLVAAVILLSLTIGSIGPMMNSAVSEPCGLRPSISASPPRRPMAICLVGGARRFELTGPSIVKHLLREYPDADLFLHGPLDRNAYKFFLLRSAPRIAAVRIFVPRPINETDLQHRLLRSGDSPNGVQGLLQYFNLVEGCLSLITAHESRHNFTYEWIVRTRVDGYWSGPLEPSTFRQNTYIVPAGSRFGGLNDRLGIGDRVTSTAALSRLSVLPVLAAAGHQNLNSESAFRAQVAANHVQVQEAALPFCIVSDRRYRFPPTRHGVPVVAMGSGGRLSGAKCRPCEARCTGECVEAVGKGLDDGWNWVDWREGKLGLCNATGPWEKGWEVVFDRVAGEASAVERTKVVAVDLAVCEQELEALRRKAELWDAPAPVQICRLGPVR